MQLAATGWMVLRSGCHFLLSLVKGGRPMNARFGAGGQGSVYRCPICGNTLPWEAPLPRFDAPCSGCGGFVWCRQLEAAGGRVLEVLPDRVPEIKDLESLVTALSRNGPAGAVVCDLSRLEMVSSAFVARLVTLNKRLRTVGGRLELSGMAPVVRDVFRTLHLDQAFAIRGGSENAA